MTRCIGATVGLSEVRFQRATQREEGTEGREDGGVGGGREHERGHEGIGERRGEPERESAARPGEDAVRGRAVELSGSLPWAPRARKRESERKAMARCEGEGKKDERARREEGWLRDPTRKFTPKPSKRLVRFGDRPMGLPAVPTNSSPRRGPGCTIDDEPRRVASRRSFRCASFARGCPTHALVEPVFGPDMRTPKHGALRIRYIRESNGERDGGRQRNSQGQRARAALEIHFRPSHF